MAEPAITRPAGTQSRSQQRREAEAASLTSVMAACKERIQTLRAALTPAQRDAYLAARRDLERARQAAMTLEQREAQLAKDRERARL